MMQRILFLFCLALTISCGEEEPNLTVTGKVNGLKKGTLYLERLQDTMLVKLDSMLVNGEPEFVLQANLEEPEVLYITLSTTNAENDIPRVPFFAAKGTTRITTSLKRFYHDAKIEGSRQQEMMNQYNDMIKQFTDKNLDNIKFEFDFRNDSLKLDSVRKVSESLLKRKYLYSVNFAMQNKTNHIAPFIAISELQDANTTYLDTLYNVLPDSIANSKYGKQLSDLIKDRKKTQNDM